MTRVSENSQTASVKFAVNKAKRKLEDLQLKGSTLKKINRPSDAPINNVEVLNLKSQNSTNDQYVKNIQQSRLFLSSTEQALEQLTNILTKAKEIAVAQSSDFYNEDVRKSVANEIHQLRNQALSIGNRRIGQRYLFGGYSTQEKPFNQEGEYQGDKGHMTLEASKDFFLPINLHGKEVFFSSNSSRYKQPHPLNRFPEMQTSPNHGKDLEKRDVDPVDLPKDLSRELASVNSKGEVVSEKAAKVEEQENEKFQDRNNIFTILDTLSTALETNSPDVVQSLLPKIESATDRVVTLRTRIGSIQNSLDNAEKNVEQQSLNNKERKRQLQDADIAELFSNISRQKNILKSTYKTSQSMLNQTLLDFLR